MENNTLLVLGCGAIGSQLVMHLAIPERKVIIGSPLVTHLVIQDRKFILVDNDTVKLENINTSAFSFNYIGANKVFALADMVFRKTHVRCMTYSFKLDGKDVGIDIFHGYHLVLDCFDNVKSRALSVGLSVPTLHVGVAANRTGACEWDTQYKLPQEDSGDNVICTHDIGRNIIRLTAAVAAGVVEEYLETGIMHNRYITNSMKILD